MAGHIRTLQKCPGCAGKFTGPGLTCPACQTRPTRYFIDLWWRRRLKIYTDPQGYPLDSYALTEQLLSTIRHQIGKGTFDPADFTARELKGLLFENYATAWLLRRQAEVGRPGSAGPISRRSSGASIFISPRFLTYRTSGISAKATSWISWRSSRRT
jgi:hypothetical protein